MEFPEGARAVAGLGHLPGLHCGGYSLPQRFDFVRDPFTCERHASAVVDMTLQTQVPWRTAEIAEAFAL